MSGDITHSLEQMEAMLRDLAPLLAKYRDYLVASGFTRAEAIWFVTAYQDVLFKSARRGEDG